MAKAKLTFNLTDPEDRLAHLCAVKAPDMALVLWELMHNTKREVEGHIEDHLGLHGSDSVGPYTALDMLYARFQEILEQHGVNVDELTC